MQFLKRISVGIITGAILGLVIGALLAFAFAPRHWVTMRYVVLGSSLAALTGAVSGLLIGILLWVLHRRVSLDRAYETLNRVLTPKVVQICWGAISGMVLGSIGGMVIEAIVSVGKLLSSPDGMYFFVSDFSPVLAVGPVVGAITGGVYGHVRRPTQKAISDLIRGVANLRIRGRYSIDHIYMLASTAKPPREHYRLCLHRVRNGS